MTEGSTTNAGTGRSPAREPGAIREFVDAVRVKVRLSGTPKEVDNATGQKITAHFQKRNRRFARLFFSAIVTILLGMFLVGYGLSFNHDTTLFFALPSVGLIMVLIGMTIYTYMVFVVSSKTLIQQLVGMMYDLDRNSEFTPDVQRTLNNYIDSISRLVAKYPKAELNDKSPDVRQVAARKAAGFYELHQWVSTPMSIGSYKDLTRRVETDCTEFLRIGLNGLPDPKGEQALIQKKDLRSIIGWGAFALACLGAGTAMIVWAEALGSALGVVVLVFLMLFLLGLVKAGIPLADLKVIGELAKSIRGSSKE